MKTQTLAEKKCTACEGKEAPLTKSQAAGLIKDITGWRLNENGKEITKELVMKNFLAAVDLINKIAKIAETENHHPDIYLTGYRNLKIVLSTHAVGGLTENDFILAAKINELPAELKK